MFFCITIAGSICDKGALEQLKITLMKFDFCQPQHYLLERAKRFYIFRINQVINGWRLLTDRKCRNNLPKSFTFGDLWHQDGIKCIYARSLKKCCELNLILLFLTGAIFGGGTSRGVGVLSPISLNFFTNYTYIDSVIS